MRKGIILAGGTGSRLYPITQVASKQLLPIYNKPLIYYPLSVLMLADIRDVLIITKPAETDVFYNLLGDGNQLGMNFDYAVQPSPNGIPEAFVIGEKFIGNKPSCLVLGDNLFHGLGITSWLVEISTRKNGATIIVAPVKDPKNYGVITQDSAGNIISIEEKPISPGSNLAITGLYFFDENVCEIAKQLKPSHRGETEITDVITAYQNTGTLSVETASRGFAWLDTGTPDSLLDAANYVATIERRQGMMVACLEEIAWRKGWIDDAAIKKAADQLGNVAYGDYLREILGAPI